MSDSAIIDAMAELLTDVPHVMFCVKDRAGRYVAVNQAFADRAGLSTPGDLVGLRASDVFPAALAASYESQDDRILTTGRAMRNELELILRPDGSVGWYVTSKTLIGERGAPSAIASVSVDLRAPADTAAVTAGVAAAVAYARARPTEQVTVAELAGAAGLSVSQLERAIRRALGVSAKQLVMRLRLEEAIVLLRTTDAPLSQIANECGYYDQSAFTRQFKKMVRMSPGAYRASLDHR